jgi:phage major head subunit gpT-like protein
MKLLERNQKVLKDIIWDNAEMRKMKESFKRVMGFEMTDEEKFPVLRESFSWSKAHSKLLEKNDFRESETSSAFTQVLRAGVQNIANSAYELVQTTYKDWVTVVPSSKAEELYAPLHGLSFPRQLGPQTKYPELRAAGLDLKLRNNKYGSMYAVEYELAEDDQTGQFQRQASMMGEYLGLLTEVLVYGKLASVANAQYLDFKVPVSETAPSGQPWVASGALEGGGSTRPASFGAFTQPNIQAGIIALMGQKNLLGQLMQVSPNRILISPNHTFDASVLLNSAYYPSGAAAAGQVGGAFAINPLKSIADLTVSRYMFDHTGAVNPSSKAWYLVDDSKPWFVLQLREAVMVEAEARNSGASFEYDVLRFKARMRGNADFIDSRFAWQGNNGSV